MRITLVIAPSALPTALVSRPTEPSNCEPRFVGGPFGMRPRDEGSGMRAQLALFVALLVFVGAGLAYVVVLGLLHR